MGEKGNCGRKEKPSDTGVPGRENERLSEWMSGMRRNSCGPFIL